MKKYFGHLYYNQNLDDHRILKFASITSRGLLYSQKCTRPESSHTVLKEKIYLIPNVPPKPKTLVLDVDETLLHSF